MRSGLFYSGRSSPTRLLPCRFFGLTLATWQGAMRRELRVFSLIRRGTKNYTSSMLWIKSLHIVFVASWFAGLLYLPRIFVNLAMVPPDSVAERARLILMGRKLLRFTTVLALPALVLGLWLYVGYGIGRGPGSGWMHAKLGVVLLTIGYHHACSRLLSKFIGNCNTRSHVWFRWFNEVPVLLLLAAVILVIVKPF